MSSSTSLTSLSSYPLPLPPLSRTPSSSADSIALSVVPHVASTPLALPRVAPASPALPRAAPPPFVDTTSSRFADPVHVYQRCGRAAALAPSRTEPQVYHLVALCWDPGHVHRHASGRWCPLACRSTSPLGVQLFYALPRAIICLWCARRTQLAPHHGGLRGPAGEPYLGPGATPLDANVVTGKWIFKHKMKANGPLDRYKARWVLWGFTQRPEVDYDETFSPVVKPGTIRTVLTGSLTTWLVHQLDVKNAFLHGTLRETVYCSQPVGFGGPGSLRHGLQTQPVSLQSQVGSPRLVQSLRHLLALTGLCRGHGLKVVA
jgi:hypothetical protein